MLSIVNADGTRTPLNVEGRKWYVIHDFYGNDTLEIEMETNNADYSLIQEEVTIYVENLRQMFTVKLIDERRDFVTISCKLNLDDWQAYVIKNARWTNSLVYNVVNDIKPNNWSVVDNAHSDQRATIEYQDGKPWVAGIPLEILDECAQTYNVVFNFDNVNKVITIVNPDTYTVSDQFFTDEVNLTDLGFTGDSSNYVTRLYGYGKIDEDTGQPLTFASVNGGKEYVEDFSYSNKIICASWSDERYTVPQNLLNDTKKKLKEQAIPVRSYSCAVNDLNEGVWLYKKVNLIDRKRNLVIVHQIVEFKEYPDAPENNVITLSAVNPSFASLFSQSLGSLESTFASMQSDMSAYIDEQVKKATDLITGNKGGVFQWVLDDQNRLTELVNLNDGTDINTAKKVWRWNASGLGHSNNGYGGPYDLALTADGAINASMITTGVLNANLIRAGRIQDLKENNWWDMVTGEFTLQPGSTMVGDKTLNKYIEDNSKDSYASETQLGIFNKLTGGGSTQGIYLRDGKVYINAAYIGAGTISDAGGNVSWNLTNGIFRSGKNTGYIGLNSGVLDFYVQNVLSGHAGGHYMGSYSTHGIAFSIETAASFIGWFYKTSASGSNFTNALSFYSKNTVNGGVTFGGPMLHAQSHLNMHSYQIIDPNWRFDGTNYAGSTVTTINFKIVDSIDTDGKCSHWYNNCKMSFVRGLLVSCTLPT